MVNSIYNGYRFEDIWLDNSCGPPFCGRRIPEEVAAVPRSAHYHADAIDGSRARHAIVGRDTLRMTPPQVREENVGSYLVRRFGLMLLTLFGISVIIFLMLRLAPGNIADILFDAAGFVDPAEKSADHEGSGPR